MKIATKIAQVILAVSVIATAIAGNAKEGTRGGGVAVVVDGQTNLRDLVDNTVCRWITAEGFAREFAPGIGRVIGRIDEVHWALAEGFRSELKSLKVCAVEGDLKQVNVDDEDGVTFYVRDQRQAAIRWNDRIWIDMKVFRELLKKNEAHAVGLLVHEIAHSFIPMDAPMRNNSLRSFVAYLMGPIDKDSMMINITEDHVSFVADTDTLPFTKADYAVMKDSKARLMDRFTLAMKKGWVTSSSFSMTSERFQQSYTIKISKSGNWEEQKLYDFVSSATADYSKMINNEVALTWKFRSPSGLRELITKYRLVPSDTFMIPFGGAQNVYVLALLTGDEKLMRDFFPTTPQQIRDVDPAAFLEATKPSELEINHAEKNVLREQMFEELMRNPSFLNHFKNYTYLPTPDSTDPTHQRIAQRICMATGGTAMQCQIAKHKMRKFIK